MTDREALTAALDSGWHKRTIRQNEAVDAAAYERLAQLPEKCGTCKDETDVRKYLCPSCHGSGKVYPAELVERVKAALRKWDLNIESTEASIAVLDALNEKISEMPVANRPRKDS